MEIFVVVSLYISVISSLVPYFTILPHFIQTAQFKVTAWLGFGSRKMFRFLLNFNPRPEQGRIMNVIRGELGPG